MRAERAPFNSNISVCLLLAQSGHPDPFNQCPLWGVKRTLRFKLPTRDEARRIAANIAKLPEKTRPTRRAVPLDPS